MKTITTSRIAQMAYVMNLIGGGMSEPRVSIKKDTHSILLNLQMAGVNPENLKLEINKNLLFIYHNLLLGADTNIPYMVYSLEMPHEVVLDLIEARFINNNLEVTMPVSEQEGGYYRAIDIKRF